MVGQCRFRVNGKNDLARQARRCFPKRGRDFSLAVRSRDAEGRHPAALPGLGTRVASPRGPLLCPGPSRGLRTTTTGQFTVGSLSISGRAWRVAAPRPWPASSAARTKSPPPDWPACMERAMMSSLAPTEVVGRCGNCHRLVRTGHRLRNARQRLTSRNSREVQTRAQYQNGFEIPTRRW